MCTRSLVNTKLFIVEVLTKLAQSLKGLGHQRGISTYTMAQFTLGN